MPSIRKLALGATVLAFGPLTTSFAQDSLLSNHVQGTAGTSPVLHAFAEPWNLRQARERARSLAPTNQASLQLSSSGATDSKIPLLSGEEGDLPRALAITPDGSLLLVACRDTDTVEYYDPLTGQRQGSTAVAESPVDVDVTPDGSLALITCVDADQVTVLDIATRSVVETLSTPGVSPFRTEISQDGSKAVVGMIGSGLLGRLAVLDLASLTVENHWATSGLAPIGFGSSPGIGVFSIVFADFALSADGSTVVVPDASFRKIRAYDRSNGSLIFEVDTGTFRPNRIDVSPDGSFGIASLTDGATGGPGAVARFDLSGGSYQAFPLNDYVHLGEARITPDGTRAAVGTSVGMELLDLNTGASTSFPIGGFFAAIEFSAGSLVTGWTQSGRIDLATETLTSVLPESYYLADLAVHPALPRMASVSYLRDEDVRGFSLTGSGISQDWQTSAGVPVEVDGPYAVGVTHDGEQAVVLCPLSRNLTVVDLVERSIQSIVSTSGPSYQLSMHPTQNLALILEEESGSAALLDVGAGALIDQAPIPGRPDRVRWNADGTRAAVLSSTNMGTSLLTSLELQGLSLTTIGTVGVPVLCTSLAISLDGGLAAVGNPIPGRVVLIDTAGPSIVDEVVTPIFVDNPTFSQDGTRVFATSSDPVLIELDTQTSPATVSLHDLPGRAMNLNLGPEERYAYAITLSSLGGGSQQRFAALDLTTSQVVSDFQVFTLPGFNVSYYPFLAQRTCDELIYVQTDYGQLWRFRLDGAESELMETRDVDLYSYGFDLSPELGLALVPYSTSDDELAVYQLAPRDLGQSTCMSNVNSTGSAAHIEARGWPCLEGVPFELHASGLPDQPYLFFAGDQALHLPFGNGTRCAGGSVRRLHVPAVAQNGLALQSINLAGAGLTTAGLWHFQCWFRDPAAGGANFDLSDAVAVELGF